MLLTRALPPQYLLPAWGMRQLLSALQRAQQSTSAGFTDPNQTSSNIDKKQRREAITPLRKVSVNHKGSCKSIERETWSHSAQRARRHESNHESLPFDHERNHVDTPSMRSSPSGKVKPRTQIEPSSSQITRSPGINGSRNPPPRKTKPKSAVPHEARSVQDAPHKTSLRKKPLGSLFDELFPEESTSTKQLEKKTVDKLPTFDWEAGPKVDWRDMVDKAAEERKNWFLTIPEANARTPNPVVGEKKRNREGNLALLVLSSASKTLEQSDFFRLGEKGEHIEGWTSGIVKVIQGRDSQSLEPLGHYFIAFSNDAAASAYLDQMLRLNKLSRTHSGRESPISLPSKFLRPGEDMKTVLRGFSLVPGQSKLCLRMLDRPYSPAVTQMLSDGGPASIARQKTNSEDMVLLSLDSGPVSWQDVRSAISADGKRRNLHWDLLEGEGAILKVGGNRWIEEDDGDSRFNRSERRSARGPTRFILSFKDSHEARRFVREWHRRPFQLQKEPRLGDEPPPTINAQMFW